MSFDTRRNAPATAARADIPGDRGLPFLGYSYQFVSGRLTTNRDRYERYGPVSWMRIFGTTIVNAQGADAVGDVLQNRERAFGSGPGWSFLIGPFFHRGLMLLDFDEHHGHRRIMQEAFTSQRLAGYLDRMNDTLRAGITSWQPGDRFRVYPAVKQLTLDVATRTFMGGEVGAEADRLNTAFVDTVRCGHGTDPRARSRGCAGRAGCTAGGCSRTTCARSWQRSGQVTATTCSARCATPVARTVSSSATTTSINHMIFLLMAAHDTSTITLTSMAYFLAKHPEWQERCRAESLAVGSELTSFADQDRLPALDMVMKESMRLITPVPGVMRRTVRDTQLGGYRVPKDTYLSTNIYGVHHDPDLWTDPERFDPERFSEERREDRRHRNAFIPFGNGVHKCIGMYFGGMEIKAAMHQMLLRYRWSVRRRLRDPDRLVVAPAPEGPAAGAPGTALIRPAWQDPSRG